MVAGAQDRTPHRTLQAVVAPTPAAEVVTTAGAVVAIVAAEAVTAAVVAGTASQQGSELALKAASPGPPLFISRQPVG